MSTAGEMSAGEYLLRGAILFLLEGGDVEIARLLLQCDIGVTSRKESYRLPKPHSATYVDIALAGPRAIYDAIAPRTNEGGGLIRHAFSAVIAHSQRLGNLSTRVQSPSRAITGWRAEVCQTSAEIEALLQHVDDDEEDDTFSAQLPEFRDETSQREAHAMATSEVDSRLVFVVHGRDLALRDQMFNFLRSIGLHPIEWTQAISATQSASPYIGQILDVAFSKAHAVVVLLTPDDEARLREPLRGPKEPAYETDLTPQARPNVLFEAGMALGRHPDRTVLVEVGALRPFSDVYGRHIIRMDNTTQRRQDLASRLSNAGCQVDLSGTDWHTVGDFTLASQHAAPSTDMARQPAPVTHGSSIVATILPPQAPILVSDGTPIFREEHPHWLKWDEPVQQLAFLNHGSSTAFNIAAVLYGCESYIIQGNRETSSRNEHWTCWLSQPAQPKERVTAEFKKGSGVFYDVNKCIVGYPFNAPPEPDPQELARGIGELHTARIVVTFHDVNGQKYVGIFDYVPHRAGWERVSVSVVDKDLSDLQG